MRSPRPGLPRQSTPVIVIAQLAAYSWIMSETRQPTPRRWVSILALGTASLLSITAALWLAWPRLSIIADQSDGAPSPHAYLPWVTHAPVAEQRVTIIASLSPLGSRVWRVVPDDGLLGLTINGRAVPLEGISPSALSDWNRGFEFDFSPWLHNGANSLEFVMSNKGGDGSLTLHPVLGLPWLVVYLGFLPWLFTLARIFRLQRHQLMPLCLALIPIMAYWSVTPWTVRTHDVTGVDGHLAYIQRIAETHTLPSPTDSWELLQAPLYYLGGALVWKWGEVTGLSIPVCLQAYSLALWLVFLCAASAAFRIALRFRTVQTSLATLVMSLWPSGIIHGLRISNDVGLYAVAGVATFAMSRWWQRQRPRDLLLMSLFVGMGLITKSNATVLAAAAGMLMTLRLLRHERWRDLIGLRHFALAVLIMTTGAALYLGRKLLYYLRGDIPDLLLGESAHRLADWLKVPSDLAHFIRFEPLTFLSSPWLVLSDDATGRALFWNSLLRSALSGEFRFQGQLQQAIAYSWGLILLLVSATLIARLLGNFRSWPVMRTYWRQLPWLLLGGLWIASLMAFRVQVPYACSNDFRFVLPVMVPLLVWSCDMRILRPVLFILAGSSLLFFVTLPYG